MVDRDETQRKQLPSIEQDLNNLANVHVATCQLHSSLDLGEVIQVMIEICINLVGMKSGAVYLHDEPNQKMVYVSGTGDMDTADLSLCDEVIAGSVSQNKIHIGEHSVFPVVVPLSLGARVLGVVVLHSLLVQKTDINDLDRQILDVLHTQAGGAILAAFMAGSEQRLLCGDDFKRQLGL